MLVLFFAVRGELRAFGGISEIVVEGLTGSFLPCRQASCLAGDAAGAVAHAEAMAVRASDRPGGPLEEAKAAVAKAVAALAASVAIAAPGGPQVESATDASPVPSALPAPPPNSFPPLPASLLLAAALQLNAGLVPQPELSLGSLFAPRFRSGCSPAAQDLSFLLPSSTPSASPPWTPLAAPS